MPANLIRRYNIQRLFHFTDEVNIDSIRHSGGLLSLDALELQGIQPARPGGNDWSHDADRYKGVHTYVHLSFLNDHPMRHVAQREGRIGQVRILEIDPTVMTLPRVLFSADVANKAGVPILDFQQAERLVDFDAIYGRADFRDPNLQERIWQARKAEVLIPNRVPLSMIRNL